MERSITFTGELDNRSISREVDQLNRRLQEAGNIEVKAEGGAPGGVGGGGDTSLADLNEGIGGLGDSLKQRMPKSISAAGGVAAAAAPVALAGAVGMGMMSAMTSASASLQTSATMLGNAWNRVWRPIGERVDDLFIRDAVEGLAEDTRQFEQLMREGREGEALETLVTGNMPGETDRRTRAAGLLGPGAGLLGGAFAGAKVGAAGGAALGSVIPGAGTAAGGTAGAVIGGAAGAIGGTAIGGRIATTLEQKLGNVNLSDLGDRIAGAYSTAYEDIRAAGSEFATNVRNVDPQDLWTGAVELGEWLWSGSIGLGEWMWSGAVPLGKWMWSEAIEWGQWMFQGAINWGRWMFSGAVGLGRWMFSGAVDMGEWMWSGTMDFADRVVGDIDIAEYVRGSLGLGGEPDEAAKGGRVAKTGLAKVHKDEFIGDADRLVGELAGAMSDAVDGSGGGGGTSVSTDGMERRLDRLHDDLRRLERALSVEVNIGDETVARAAANGQRHGISDSNPKV